RTENAFPGAYSYKGVSSLLPKEKDTASLSPILPLQPTFITHFTPDYLCQNVTFSGNEKEITVSLSIVLEPKGSGRGKPIRFSRKYSHEAKEIEYGRLPEVRVWPEYQE